MATIPQLIFLDTNVYLIGAIDLNSTEGQILQWLGWDKPSNYGCEVLISEELFEQIYRVAKRLKNKDWAGEIIGRIWQNLKVRYVQIDDSGLAKVEPQGIIPREDVGVYLTAKEGQAQCFVSANHKLIRILVQQTGEFECLTPSEFVSKYLIPFLCEAAYIYPPATPSPLAKGGLQGGLVICIFMQNWYNIIRHR